MRTIGIFTCLLVLLFTPGRPNRLELSSEARHLHAALDVLLHRATALRENGRYQQAADLFEAGRRQAKLRGNVYFEVRFLLGVAACHFVRHQYRQALQDYSAGRVLLSSFTDTHSSIILNGSLSSLYSQLGEYDAAMESARRALAVVPPQDRSSYRAKLLIILATLAAHQGDAGSARELFKQGILEADRFGDTELRANAWDRLGCEFLAQNQLSQAEDYLLEAYRIRKLNRLQSLGESYRNLGILRLEQGDLRSASALLDVSIVKSKSPQSRVPQWRFYQARGRLRLAEGKLRQAHADFGLALELARNYRLAVPPSDAIRIGLEGLLQEVYASYAETGSRLYIETGGAALARETFEAVEENRAASLSARLDERKLLRRNLPSVYWERMDQLEAAESATLLGGGERPRQAMRRLRGALIELEVKAGGAGFTLRPDLLENTRRALDSSTILLSFHLARPASSLWVVAESGLSLYALPGRMEIARQATAFRQAILTGGPDAEIAGRQLYRTLFGALAAEYRNKPQWLLSLDEGLFDLPFAALVADGKPGVPVYLIERHTIRMISGAVMWAARPPRQNPIAGGFVGVGDAIYNMADARWPGRERAEPKSSPWPVWLTKVSAAAPLSLGLSRLSGSGQEIEACAREWDSSSVLIEGREATRQNVRLAVAAKPAIIHFAAHILQSHERSTSAMIALSLADSGRDELLGPAEIGGWNTGGGLVVLSGCSSGTAAPRPGAGLMGLTRAWLMAGARAVVASTWATPDDVGVFFRRFYRQLRRSQSRDPADALRVAQIDALQSHDWRSHPRYWAAYFALGNY